MSAAAADNDVDAAMAVASINETKMSLDSLQRDATDREDALDNRLYSLISSNEKLSHKDKEEFGCPSREGATKDRHQRKRGGETT